MKLIHGDCLEVMRGIVPNSVDAIVTDPPYGLGFMGKQWDALPPGREVFEQCLRVLKPGGHLLAFGGTRTYHRLAVAVEDAGFEIRDMIAWVYGNGMPKTFYIKKNKEVVREGFGGSLKPAYEPIVVARKSFRGTIADTMIRHGTGALNIDGCRVKLLPGDRKSEGGANASGSRQRDGGFAMTAGDNRDGLGRWPANLIHDGSDEVLALFPAARSYCTNPATAKSAESNEVSGGGNGVTFFQGAGTKSHRPLYADSGAAARFFYCPKASKADRNEGLEEFEAVETMRYGEQAQGPQTQQTPRKPVAQRNTHPTVKPTDLMRYLCRLITPPGGVILDPFMGSGSTGKAARLEGFDFIGIEKEPEYIPIAEARIAAADPDPEQPSLFAQASD